MSGVSGIGGGAMSVDRVMALRSQILERNQALSRAGAAGNVAPTETVKPTSFADSMETALKSVNDGQTQAAKLSESYERGGGDQADHQRHRQRAADRGLRERALDLLEGIGEPFGRAGCGDECGAHVRPACS